ncbi:MAG TPA: cyclopropane-fatty-acyl-phospholipid synthase family protein [Baekduia sp.]|uniref:cyclopropane-fatty-acyl-phospholipid synthase family protein n=1 Tax=Baekduia sp. TaxID=2600305 RepID=UPI002D772F7B|nr:cyclopropane-fatty-acyl-phospholipid synthase family protein [Baekduia sp.]HET6507140.1 cyclopropane-fatty-acyl-phospholipid synthase family protein [Baekduia sp.]
MAFSRPAPFREELARALPERPFDIAFWDGSTLPATNGDSLTTFRVTSPLALAHVLRAPGQLGIGRAYVSGALDVDDIDAAIDVLDQWKPPALDTKQKLKLAAAAARATGVVAPPKPPKAELIPQGRRHSIERDKAAVRHHYDVSNEYFAQFLDPSMTYSCAIFSRGAKTLEEAQWTKRELVCTKLNLQPGERVLDVGCGWGAFAIHAAKEHGVHVTGITLSEPQAELARQRAREAGVGDQVDIKVMDWRELRAEPFDAISSIGMVEHVGSGNIDNYAVALRNFLKPGGRLLNHGIGRLRWSDPEAGPFSERYVFPDGAPLHVSRILAAMERGGLEPTHVEGFRMDYAETLKHWADNFDANLPRAIELGGEERVRVWRLYLRTARRGFETGFLSVFQVLCTRT